MTYVMIDGVEGSRNFLFWIAYVRIDGAQGVEISFFGWVM
jgi:hypothetical protein